MTPVDPLFPDDTLEADWDRDTLFLNQYSDVTPYRQQAHFRGGLGQIQGHLRPGLYPGTGTVTLRDINPATNLFDWHLSPIRDALTQPIHMRCIANSPLAQQPAYSYVASTRLRWDGSNDWSVELRGDMVYGGNTYTGMRFAAANGVMTWSWLQAGGAQFDPSGLTFRLMFGTVAGDFPAQDRPVVSASEGEATRYTLTFAGVLPDPVSIGGQMVSLFIGISEPDAALLDRVRWEAIAQPPSGDRFPVNKQLTWTLYGLEWNGLNRSIGSVGSLQEGGGDPTAQNPQPIFRMSDGQTIRQVMFNIMRVAGIEIAPDFLAAPDPGIEVGTNTIPDPNNPRLPQGEIKVQWVLNELAKLAHELLVADTRGRMRMIPFLEARAPNADVSHLYHTQTHPVEPEFDRRIAYIGQWDEDDSGYFLFPGNITDQIEARYQTSSVGWTRVAGGATDPLRDGEVIP